MKTPRGASHSGGSSFSIKAITKKPSNGKRKIFEFTARNANLCATCKREGHRLGARYRARASAAAHLVKFVGAPEGNYESMIFKTAFEHKSPTGERVILLKQPIGWRVIDYRIY